MTNKMDSLNSYLFQVTDYAVMIAASSSLKVKSTIPLSSLHMQNAKKQLQDSHLEDSKTQNETLSSTVSSPRTFLYPAKLVLPKNKCRLAFFENP